MLHLALAKHWGSDDENDIDFDPSKKSKPLKQKTRNARKRKRTVNPNDLPVKVPRTRSQTRSSCNWTFLPPEILLKIFEYIAQSDMGSVPSLCKLSQVCRSWWKVSRTPSLWTRVSFSSAELPNPKKWRGTSQSARSFRNAVNQYFSRFKCVKFIGYQKAPCQELLNAVISNCNDINELGFFNCKINLKNEKIAKMIENNKGSLKSLKIKNSHLNRLPDNPFKGLGEALEELVVETSTYLNNKNFFQFTGIRNITVLKITIFGKSCFDLGQLEALEKVQVVHITQTVLGIRTDTALKVNWPDLVELNLAFDNNLYINMHCDTINLLYLIRKSSKLEILNLKNRTPLSLSKLSELCPSNCLKKLDISGCIGPGFVGIFNKWRGTLEELYMDGCKNFTDEFIGLSECGALESLKIISFEKTPVTETFITSLLKKYTGLTSLNLQCCKQLPRGWKQLYCNLNLKKFRKRVLK